MSLFDCVDSAIQAGEMDRARGQALQDIVRVQEKR